MCRPTKRPKPTSQFEGAVVPLANEASSLDMLDLKRPSSFEFGAELVVPLAVPPPASKQTFVYTTYEMVSNEENAQAVGWDSTGMLIQIRDATMFGEEILPKYFRHKNVTSFYRQLNSYGFRTVKTSSIEVSHTFLCDLFRRDSPDLLPLIVRKKAAPPPAALAAVKKQQQQHQQARAPQTATAVPPSPPAGSVPSTTAAVMRMIQELRDFQRNQQVRAEQLEANIRRLSGENNKILREGESVISSMKAMVHNQTDAIEKLFGPKASEAFMTQLKAETEQQPLPASPMAMSVASPFPEADPFGLNKVAVGSMFPSEQPSKMLLPDDDLLELETLLAFEDDGFMF